MIRTTACVLAGITLTLSVLSAAAPARADGPVEQTVNQVADQIPGAPHCC